MSQRLCFSLLLENLCRALAVLKFDAILFLRLNFCCVLEKFRKDGNPFYVEKRSHMAMKSILLQYVQPQLPTPILCILNKHAIYEIES